MCAQTRPCFILSSKRGLGGMKSEPMLTPREKSTLPEAQRTEPGIRRRNKDFCGNENRKSRKKIFRG